MLVITPEHYLVVFGIKYRDYGILTVEIKSDALNGWKNKRLYKSLQKIYFKTRGYTLVKFKDSTLIENGEN